MKQIKIMKTQTGYKIVDLGSVTTSKYGRIIHHWSNSFRSEVEAFVFIKKQLKLGAKHDIKYSNSVLTITTKEI